MLSSLFSIKRAAFVALIVLAFGIRAHAQIEPNQINFANGACTSLQYYSPFDNTCHDIASGGNPNGQDVTGSWTITTGVPYSANCPSSCTATLPSSIPAGFTDAIVNNSSTVSITVTSAGPTYTGVTTIPPGQQLFLFTNGTEYRSGHLSPGGGGLGDPGGNGFIFRTALNTTAVGTLSQLIAAYWSDSSCSSNLYMKKDGTCGTPSGSAPSVTFNIATGATASPAAPFVAAPQSGAVSHCYFTTLTSDGAIGLVFNVKFNGSSILSGSSATVTAGTSTGTISTFSLTSGSVSITAGQKWELDITGGSSAWTGAVQCY